jgi:hypothetical protein
MELGPGIWGPIVATAVMLLGAGLAYLLLLLSRRYIAPKPSAEKLKTYGCGEEVKPEETHVDSEQFYSAVRRAFKPFYKYVQPKHSGVLNTYLLWVIVGFVIVLIAVMLSLR